MAAAVPTWDAPEPTKPRNPRSASRSSDGGNPPARRGRDSIASGRRGDGAGASSDDDNGGGGSGDGAGAGEGAGSWTSAVTAVG
jgi:hypothetical protein